LGVLIEVVGNTGELQCLQITVDRSFRDFEFSGNGLGVPLASALDKAQDRKNAG
jgi:hypothetical protein